VLPSGPVISGALGGGGVSPLGAGGTLRVFLFLFPFKCPLFVPLKQFVQNVQAVHAVDGLYRGIMPSNDFPRPRIDHFPAKVEQEHLASGPLIFPVLFLEQPVSDRLYSALVDCPAAGERV